MGELDPVVDGLKEAMGPRDASENTVVGERARLVHRDHILSLGDRVGSLNQAE